MIDGLASLGSFITVVIQVRTLCNRNYQISLDFHQVRSIMKSVHTSQVYIYYVYVNRTPIIMKSDPSNMRQPSQGSTITVCCTEDFGPYQGLIPWYLKLDFWYLRVFSGSLRTPHNQTSLVEELERVQNTCMVFFFFFYYERVLCRYLYYTSISMYVR